MERIDNQLIDLGVASEETKGQPVPISLDSQGSHQGTGLTED